MEQLSFKTEFDVLSTFLKFPLQQTEEVFNKFRAIKGAKWEMDGNNSLHQYCYIPGTRKEKVLLIAHADTLWDENYYPEYKDFDPSQIAIYQNHGILYDPIKNIFRSREKICGLGADDRAGCAMLWLLKDLGHSLLIVSGEEHGQRTSNWIMNMNKALDDEINNDHQFLVQLDRKNNSDFKCYDVGTQEFRDYVAKMTLFNEPDVKAKTDVKVLSRLVCGVNLSIGYNSEHKPEEELNFNDWYNTYQICKRWLNSPSLPKYKR